VDAAKLGPVESWPEPVRRVAEFLHTSRAEARVEEFADGTPTAQAAADAVGCELGAIVKSLVVECDGRAAVVMVPGDRRADLTKVARELGGSKARVASPERVRAVTGFDPGAVAPFPLADVDTVLVERTLLARDIVWVGAGSERHMAGLTAAELVRLSRARPVDVVPTA
jgi:prolyl-tRNA editing enzyme YbaK/EbsC (Cys-tRNA(Pro) deacylase)